jgi:hypothetical protein
MGWHWEYLLTDCGRAYLRSAIRLEFPRMVNVRVYLPRVNLMELPRGWRRVYLPMVSLMEYWMEYLDWGYRRGWLMV